MMFYTLSFPIPFLYPLTFARWEVDSLLLRTRIAFNLFSKTSSNRSVLLNMCHLSTSHVIEKKEFFPHNYQYYHLKKMFHKTVHASQRFTVYNFSKRIQRKTYVHTGKSALIMVNHSQRIQPLVEFNPSAELRPFMKLTQSL